MKAVRQVAVLVETSRSYGRGVLRGVARYNRERGRWSTYFRPHGLGDPVPAWLKNWQGDGILARIDNRRTAEALLASGLPVVNLRGTLSELKFPFVGTNNRLVAKLGADHLLVEGGRDGHLHEALGGLLEVAISLAGVIAIEGELPDSVEGSDVASRADDGIQHS